jgi:predicted SnoaL-like aldol condensation-catalyzing enzyme
MRQTVEEKNKAIVREAFETLFNRRDHMAAERFWSPDYIQHSAHIPPGREGLFDLIRSIPWVEKPGLRAGVRADLATGSAETRRVFR